MHLRVLSSGSKGNSLLVRHGDASLLVDAGLTAAAMDERLERARLGIDAVNGVLVTHGHLDHTRSAGILSRRWRVPLWCAPAVQSNAAIRRSKRMETLSPARPLEIGAGAGCDALLAHVHEIPHDAAPTYAVRLEGGGRRAAVLTDMGRPCDRAAAFLAGAHVLVLEFNYDPELLDAGPYPASLKRRIRSGRGHLSNAQGAEMLRALAGPELHTLVLAHVSETNNTPEHARACAEETLRAIGREDVAVHVASQWEVGPNIEV
ncbi:MAG: MBL fold metallo-hydrolase [Planctomycetota bacterium]